MHSRVNSALTYQAFVVLEAVLYLEHRAPGNEERTLPFYEHPQRNADAVVAYQLERGADRLH